MNTPSGILGVVGIPKLFSSTLSSLCPPQAAVAGFTTLTFADEFNSPSTIDTLNSGTAGFQWYLRPGMG